MRVASKIHDHKQKIPTLKFPEFDGDWEERKLGDIATFSKGKSISKMI